MSSWQPRPSLVQDMRVDSLAITRQGRTAAVRPLGLVVVSPFGLNASTTDIKQGVRHDWEDGWVSTDAGEDSLRYIQGIGKPHSG